MYSRANGQFSVVTAGEIIGEIFRLVSSSGIDYMTLDAIQNWPGYAYALGPSLRMHHNADLVADSAIGWTTGPTTQTDHQVWVWGPSRNVATPARLQFQNYAPANDDESSVVILQSSSHISGAVLNEAKLTLNEYHNPTSSNALGLLEINGKDSSELQVSVSGASNLNKFTLTPTGTVHTLNFYGTQISVTVNPVYFDTTSYSALPDGALVVNGFGQEVLVNDIGIGRTMFAKWQTWNFPMPGVTLGNGTWQGAYQKLGQTIHARGELVLGATTVLPAGGITIDLPYGPFGSWAGYNGPPMATISLIDISTGDQYGASIGWIANRIVYPNPTLPGNRLANVTPTAPFTFAPGDVITVTIDYPYDD